MTLAITAFLFFLFLALPLPRGAIPGAIAIRIALRVTLLGLIASCLAAALRRAAHLTISEAILSSRAQIVHRDLSQSEPVSYPQARVVETMVRSSTRRLRCFGESRENEVECNGNKKLRTRPEPTSLQLQNGEPTLRYR